MPRQKQQMTYDELTKIHQQEKVQKARDKAQRKARKAKNEAARQKYAQVHKPKPVAPEGSGKPIPDLPAPGEIVRVDLRDWALFKQKHGVRLAAVEHHTELRVEFGKPATVFVDELLYVEKETDDDKPQPSGNTAVA